ncbi:MAG: polymerase ECF-type sigma factor [Chitinophagaceae bacterium]|nr:polymerase ECF-type sigma factor [Chitinophagaceae bacterium]
MSISESAFNNSQLNDEEAFEMFFKQNFAALCAYCGYKFDFTLDLSKEVVHSAFIKLWENRSALSPGLSVKAYLYKIITNNCLDILKHEQVKQKYRVHIHNSFSEEAAIEFDQIDTKELAAKIDEAVSELPDQMRKIFELSRYEGLKYAAIAAHLNISVKTVETQMSRALARLRERLSDYLYLVFIVALPWL